MSEQGNFKFFVIVVLGIVALICVYYFTNRTQNAQVQIPMKNVENFSMEESDNAGVDYHTSMEMDNVPAPAQDFPPETHTEQSNQPPLVGAGVQANLSKNENPAIQQLRQSACFPKEMLSPEELKPQDNSSLWAQVNPSGVGSLKDKNFLQASHHIGINTVGQTLRNANLQLRSEPPCPQVQVSPWLQTTIEPDLSRKPFEIGGCA